MCTQPAPSVDPQISTATPSRPPTAGELAQTVAGEPPAPALTRGRKPGPRAAGGPSGDLPHQGSVLLPPSPLSLLTRMRVEARSQRHLLSSHPQRCCLSGPGAQEGTSAGHLVPCRSGVGGPGPPSTPRSEVGASRQQGWRVQRFVQAAACPGHPPASREGAQPGRLALMFPEPRCFCSKVCGAPTGPPGWKRGWLFRVPPSPRYPPLAGETAP